jgi:hypothetical protein
MTLSITGNSVSASLEADGRSIVIETQNVSDGTTITFEYVLAVGDNAQTIANARGSALPAVLAADEVTGNISKVITQGSLASLTFNWSTVAANAAALRSVYFNATQLQAVMIGDFLSSLTDGQLQAAFGLTAGQVTTLRTNKLTPAATLASNIRGSIGQ